MALNLLLRSVFRRRPRQDLSPRPVRRAARAWPSWLVSRQSAEDVRFTDAEIALLQRMKERRDGPPAQVAVAVRRCRVCKCTDERPCFAGCSWVEADLCSACAVTP